MGAKPSSIDRLPKEVRDLIGKKRRDGCTLDEILAHLNNLLPVGQMPSRSALGRHTQRIDVLGERIKVADAMADRLVGDLKDDGGDKIMRANARLLGSAVFDLLSAVEDGEPVTIEPKDAKALSETLRNISTAQKNHAEFAAQIRKEIEAELRSKLEAAAAGKGGFNAEAAEEARRILGFA